MTEEEREESKRKQREYQRDHRARQKAASQNNCTSTVLTQTLSRMGNNCSNLEPSTQIILGKENIPRNMDQSTPIILYPWDHLHECIGSSTTPLSAQLGNVRTTMTTQQRKRTAEMYNEQKEWNRRQRGYQRDYRARKKAASQISGGSTSVSTRIVQSSSLAGVNLGTGLSRIVENEESLVMCNKGYIKP
ncbi:hypothetical protein BDA96_04G184800 [Sorghum bicolor]|uniref:Uncharacterized protein n=2 Tax=Sorghum bicolor TaxID=4558 RepID=A0A194YQC1_SORBI|nr:hypothetical protein BDA96_04G184800 [Sorghum bicolor]KXG30428.2 hypothetical protein SORBI_3004G172350 [Sorghum bicolor]